MTRSYVAAGSITVSRSETLYRQEPGTTLERLEVAADDRRELVGAASNPSLSAVLLAMSSDDPKRQLQRVLRALETASALLVADNGLRHIHGGFQNEIQGRVAALPPHGRATQHATRRF